MTKRKRGRRKGIKKMRILLGCALLRHHMDYLRTSFLFTFFLSFFYFFFPFHFHEDMDTRGCFQVPLINEAPIECLGGIRLPTKGQVFCHFWYHYKVLGKKCPLAQREAALAATAAWRKVGLDPKGLRFIVKDIADSYTALQVYSCYSLFLSIIVLVSTKIIVGMYSRNSENTRWKRGPGKSLSAKWKSLKAISGTVTTQSEKTA